MTVIDLTDYNTTCYGVTFQKNGCVRVQKFEDIPDDEKNILCVKPLGTILSKSEICETPKVRGAYDEKIFHGNTILLKITENIWRKW